MRKIAGHWWIQVFGVDVLLEGSVPSDTARILNAADELLTASKNLREAQKAYMADRGNQELGREVANKARILDDAIDLAEGH